MANSQIENLSAIMEQKHMQDSQMTFEESKPRPQVVCPTINNENYGCPICNRLRKVCPFTRMQTCQHQHRQRVVSRHEYNYIDKSNMSTLPAERLRTYSVNQTTKNVSDSRKERIIVPQQNSRTYVQQSTYQQQHQIHLPPTEEVIYYPVIHNTFVKSTTLEKSPMSTPSRDKRSRRVDFGEKILTPTQFKQLLDSYRQE